MKLVVIKPKADPLNIRAVERAVKAAMHEGGQRGVELIEQVGGDWSKPVTGRVVEERDGVRVEVTGPGAEIFGYLDKGTAPHDIVAKGGGVLAFSPGSQPRTRPRILSSRSRSKGSGVIFRKRVRHPGIAPRHFSETIQEQMQDELPVIMAQHIGGAVQG